MTAVRSRNARHSNVTRFQFPFNSIGGWFRTLLRAGPSSAVVLLCCCLPAIPVRAQPILPQEDPENERKLGAWYDETLSIGLSPNRSLEFAFHQRFDEGGTNLFAYFFTGGMEFRPRSWLAILPAYRYIRYPPDATTTHENRLMLTITTSVTRGRWRPILRTRIEGRIPENRIASARIRFRPGIEYTLPLRMRRPPVVIINNEFFVVPGRNSFSSNSAYTQNRFQAGVRFSISESFAVRPYYMRQWVNPATGWDSNGVIGLSVAVKL